MIWKANKYTHCTMPHSKSSKFTHLGMSIQINSTLTHTCDKYRRGLYTNVAHYFGDHFFYMSCSMGRSTVVATSTLIATSLTILFYFTILFPFWYLHSSNIITNYYSFYKKIYDWSTPCQYYWLIIDKCPLLFYNSLKEINSQTSWLRFQSISTMSWVLLVNDKSVWVQS
jgi:hypothetical protein